MPYRTSDHRISLCRGDGSHLARWSVAIALWALLSALWIGLAVHAVPVVNGDAAYFVPTAYFIRTEGLWLSPIARPLDPMSSALEPARYVYHGWLYPYAVAKLAPAATWEGIFIGRAAVSSLAFGTIALGAAATFRSVAAVLLACVVAAGVLSFASGRPETIAAPLLLLLAYRTISRSSSIIPDALILGVLFVAQPTVCLSASIGYTLYRSVIEPTPRTLISIAAVAALAIATALALFEFAYPLSLADWFRGVLNQADRLSDRREWDTFAGYYLTSSRYPLLGVPIAGATAMLLFTAWRQAGDMPRAPRMAAAGVFLFVTLFGALKVPATIYNVVPWTLVFAWCLLDEVQRCGLGSRWLQRLIAVAMAILVLSSATMLARSAAQDLVSVGDDRASLRASRRVAQAVAATCGSLQVNFPVLPLLDREALSPRISYQPLPPNGGSLVPSVDAVIFAQYGSGSSAEPSFSGMTLAYSSYRTPPSIAGIRLFNTPTSHNIAVLLRSNSDCLKEFRRAFPDVRGRSR